MGLYYHVPNGSVMKGLLAIRHEGGGPVVTGQWMAVQGPLGISMSPGS